MGLRSAVVLKKPLLFGFDINWWGFVFRGAPVYVDFLDSLGSYYYEHNASVSPEIVKIIKIYTYRRPYILLVRIMIDIAAIEQCCFSKVHEASY